MSSKRRSSVHMNTNSNNSKIPITFEQWITKELGQDIVNEVKTNCYINYGPIKYIFEYLFLNLYHPDFVRLVKLNLNMKNGKELDGIKNDKLTQLKLRNNELSQKILDLKSQYDEEEIELERLFESMSDENEHKQALNAKLNDKQLNGLIQELYLDKAKFYTNKFQIAAKNLTRIFNSKTKANASNMTSMLSKTSSHLQTRWTSNSMSMSSMNHLNDIDSYESTLGEKCGDETTLNRIYEILRLEHQKSQNTAQSSSANSQSSKFLFKESSESNNRLFHMNHVEIVDFMECFKMKIASDFDNINKINDKNTLINELKLSLYECESNMNEINSIIDSYHENVMRQNQIMANCDNEAGSFETISYEKLFKELLSKKNDQRYFDYLLISSQNKFYQTSKANLQKEMNFYKRPLQDYVKENSSLFAKYLKSHLRLKVSETNWIELEKWHEKFKMEMQILKTNLSVINQKQTLLQKLNESIAELNNAISLLMTENEALLQSKSDRVASNALNDLNVGRNLADLIQKLSNMNVSVSRHESIMISELGGATCEISIQRNFSKYKQKFDELKQASTSSAGSSLLPLLQCGPRKETKNYLIEEVLNYRSFKSKCFIVQRVYQLYNQLISELKQIDNKYNLAFSQELTNIRSLAKNVNHLTRKCLAFDQRDLKKYEVHLSQALEKCRKTNAGLDDQAKLVDTWWKQPGVYECPLENLTVNGKPLTHYYEMIEKQIAEMNAKCNSLY